MCDHIEKLKAQGYVDGSLIYLQRVDVNTDFPEIYRIAHYCLYCLKFKVEFSGPKKIDSKTQRSVKFNPIYLKRLKDSHHVPDTGIEIIKVVTPVTPVTPFQRVSSDFNAAADVQDTDNDIKNIENYTLDCNNIISMDSLETYNNQKTGSITLFDNT